MGLARDTLLCSYFSTTYPAAPLISFRTYPAVPLSRFSLPLTLLCALIFFTLTLLCPYFFCTYLAVPLSRFSLTAYPAVCSFFSLRLLCCVLIFCALTLLCSYFSSHLDSTENQIGKIIEQIYIFLRTYPAVAFPSRLPPAQKNKGTLHSRVSGIPKRKAGKGIAGSAKKIRAQQGECEEKQRHSRVSVKKNKSTAR